MEFGIQIFWHFRENCRFCILGQFPFPTILQNSGLHRLLTILFYLLTYLKIKHRHRFSTFQTCTNLFQSVQPTGCYCSVWQPGLSVGYISVTSRSRFAGRVATAFTESKSIPFHTNLSGASRNNWYYSVGNRYCHGVTVPISLTFY